MIKLARNSKEHIHIEIFLGERLMKNYIRNILLDKMLWIFGAIVIVFFGVLSQMEFALDTYATLCIIRKIFACICRNSTENIKFEQ